MVQQFLYNLFRGCLASVSLLSQLRSKMVYACQSSHFSQKKISHILSWLVVKIHISTCNQKFRITSVQVLTAITGPSNALSVKHHFPLLEVAAFIRKLLVHPVID